MACPPPVVRCRPGRDPGGVGSRAHGRPARSGGADLGVGCGLVPVDLGGGPGDSRPPLALRDGPGRRSSTGRLADLVRGSPHVAARSIHLLPPPPPASMTGARVADPRRCLQDGSSQPWEGRGSDDGGGRRPGVALTAPGRGTGARLFRLLRRRHHRLPAVGAGRAARRRPRAGVPARS